MLRIWAEQVVQWFVIVSGISAMQKPGALFAVFSGTFRAASASWWKTPSFSPWLAPGVPKNIASAF
jgi:hypothetical protein